MERETDYLVRANGRRWILITGAVVALVASSVGLYEFLVRDPYSEHEIRRLIDQAYNRQRPGSGRLYRAAYFPVADGPAVSAELGKAQLLLLQYPESETRQQLQGLIYLASGKWQKYVEIAGRLSQKMRRDAALPNNLGASYLALSEFDANYLLKALDQFERASQLDPMAPEPVFNLVITYRQLRLHRLEEGILGRYASLDHDSPWKRELTNRAATDEPALVEELKKAVESDNQHNARRIFERDPDLFRRYVREYESSNTEESPAVLHFIASEMERRYGDRTTTGMLAPLFTGERNANIALRQFVT